MPTHRRKDGGAWEVSVSWPGRGTVRKSSRHWTRKDAKQIEVQTLQELKDHSFGRYNYSLAKAIETWLTDYVPRLHGATEVKNHLRILLPFIKGLRLVDAPIAAKRVRTELKHLAPSTINQKLAIIRRVCNLAYDEWGWLEQPIGKKIKLLTVHNERHIYLTRAQVEGLAQACELRAAGDLIVFAAFTGLRHSEMFRATAAHVRDARLFLQARTKNGKPRAIPLHPRALAIAERLPLPITPCILRAQWDIAREKTMLQHVHWHDLRHTCASWLIQSGATLLEVRNLLGHCNVGVTERYAHLTPEHLKAAVDRM